MPAPHVLVSVARSGGLLEDGHLRMSFQGKGVGPERLREFALEMVSRYTLPSMAEIGHDLVVIAVRAWGDRAQVCLGKAGTRCTTCAESDTPG